MSISSIQHINANPDHKEVKSNSTFLYMTEFILLRQCDPVYHNFTPLKFLQGFRRLFQLDLKV